MALASAAAAPAQGEDALRISWDKDILTVASKRLPGGKVEVWYLEAFCRRGSTDRDWRRTVIPFKTEKVAADPAGRWLKLETIVDGKVRVRHEIRSGTDEVDFRLEIENTTERPVDIEWAQPCIRVGTFTGLGQKDYFTRCFIFTERGLTRMHQTHRETHARYTPGQVYVPAGISLDDVNPRPISKTRPVNGLVGCFSADERLILAMAWDRVQELFQGVIVCIHSDFRIGGLSPGQVKRLHGKLYIVDSDVEQLLKRYGRDFSPDAPPK